MEQEALATPQSSEERQNMSELPENFKMPCRTEEQWENWCKAMRRRRIVEECPFPENSPWGKKYIELAMRREGLRA